MTASIATYVFACKAATISPLSTDVAGAAATYGTKIYIPGAMKVTVNAPMDVKKLQANFQTLAIISTLKDVTVDIEFSEFDPNIFALLTGAALTPGTGTDYAIGLNSSNVAGFFGFEAVSLGANGAGSNFSITLNKLVATEIPTLGFTDEDFQKFTLKCAAVNPVGTSNWIDVGYHSTAVVL